MTHRRVAMEWVPSLAQQARTDPDLAPLGADPMFEQIVGR
jgi:hypothetical protein